MSKTKELKKSCYGAQREQCVLGAVPCKRLSFQRIRRRQTHFKIRISPSKQDGAHTAHSMRMGEGAPCMQPKAGAGRIAPQRCREASVTTRGLEEHGRDRGRRSRDHTGIAPTAACTPRSPSVGTGWTLQPAPNKPRPQQATLGWVGFTRRKEGWITRARLQRAQGTASRFRARCSRNPAQEVSPGPGSGFTLIGRR